MMDYDISEVDDREKFPPKVIWVSWDYSGEYMDTTADPEQGEHWEKTRGEHLFKYVLA